MIEKQLTHIIIVDSHLIMDEGAFEFIVKTVENCLVKPISFHQQHKINDFSQFTQLNFNFSLQFHGDCNKNLT